MLTTPLLAHLDPHFSTCYPQLEKKILIFTNQAALRSNLLSCSNL